MAYKKGSATLKDSNPRAMTVVEEDEWSRDQSDKTMASGVSARSRCAASYLWAKLGELAWWPKCKREREDQNSR